MPAVRARGWGWRHPGRRAWALRGLDLVIEHGERVLLLGASGSGKSTLLAGLAGVLDPRSGGEAEGELLVDGSPPDRAHAAAAGLLFQDPEDQLVHAAAGDDVAFGLENRCVPLPEIWPRVDEALGAVGFPYGRDRATADLSGGEKQRLALAGVLAPRPRLLMLDEPTSNLDRDAAGSLRELVAALTAGGDRTLLLVEHHVGDWLPLIDRVVVLEAGGGVLVDGDPDTVFTRDRVRLEAAGVWVPDSRTAEPAPGVGDDARHYGEAAGEALVQARGVTLRYPTTGDGVGLDEGVDAEIRAGEVLAITGPNGSGKTTLALLLAGLLAPDAGSVVATAALGSVSNADAALVRWPARRLVRSIGTLLQNPEHQFLTSRVDEEIALGVRRASLDPALVVDRVAGLLDRLRLTALAAASPFTLSGGEQRRLSLAAALVTDPAALVLDEPSFGLDRRTHLEVTSLLRDERDSGTGLCLVSHDELMVSALADARLALARRAPSGSAR